MIFQSENVSSKKKLKRLKNFNTDSESGTQKREARQSLCLKQFL